MRVLLVDDSPSFRAAARELLAFRGYVVVGEATSAQAALEDVERLSPDAVLLDVRLPDGNGFEVARRLSRLPDAPAVLLMSADSQEPDPAVVQRCGARGFVLKSRLTGVDFVEFFPEP